MRVVRWEMLALCGLTGLWCLAVGWLALARHMTFHTGYDLGTFAQVVWGTAHGRPFYTSLTDGTANFLGFHFAPLLAVLAPIYGVWPDARVLLVAQTVALAVGTVPLYAFARPRLGAGLTLVVIAAYLLSPCIHYIALSDFHEIALAVPLLMAAGASLLNHRLKATVAFLGLALLAKEEVALIAVGFGLYAWLFLGHKRFGIALTAGAVLWSILLFGLVMPAFSQSRDGYPLLWRYATLGKTPGQVLDTLLTRPELVVRTLATETKGRFLLQLLAPLAGLPLLGWPVPFLALPTLAYLLLSDYEFQTSIAYHYTAPLMPCLFLATVVAIQRLGARSARLGQLSGAVLLLAALVSAWWWSPLPGGRTAEPGIFAVSEEDRQAHRLLATIPPDAAVASDWAYLPWLANRWVLDTLLSPPFPLVAPNRIPDYVVTQTPGPGAVSAPIYPWIIPDSAARSLIVPRFVSDEAVPGRLSVWKRLGPAQDVVMSRYDVPFEHGLTLAAAGTPPEAPSWGPVIQVQAGTTLPVWMAWTAHNPPDRRFTFTLHLVDDDHQLYSQVDQEMGAGRFPTTRWYEWNDNPIVVAEFPLEIPSNLPAGRYRLLTGAYESQTVVPLRREDGRWWVGLALVDVK